VAGFGVQPIVATLILMVSGRGLAQLITEGQIITVNSSPFKLIGAGYWLTVPFSIILSLALVAVVALLVRRSALGLLIEAVGGNAEASRLAGVRSRRIIWTVYILSGVCAGVAGLMIASNTAGADGNHAGLWIELDAILAVVIGGTLLSGGRFSIAGTVIGALLIQTLTTTVYATGVPSQSALLVKALVVTAVCLIQSPAFRSKVLGRRRRGSPPAAQPAQRTADVEVPA
jgi:ribose/xylose/arabinose/galactoside ABC-type transport system permease subunit